MSGFKKADSVYDQMILDAEWWIPSDPDYKLRGTLNGSVADGFILNLEGAFLQDHEDIQIIDVIIGQSRSGTKYTLLSNYYLGAKRRISHPKSPDIRNEIDSEYRANWTITGEHFYSYEDVRFESISFAISNFEHWHFTKAFQVDYPESNNRSFRVQYQNPDPVIIFYDDKVKAIIEYSYSHTGVHPSGSTYQINQRASIRLTSVNSPLLLFDFEENGDASYLYYLHRITTFVKFATQKHVFAYDINSGSQPFPISIYFKSDVSQESAKPVKFYDIDKLIRWRDIEHDPQKYIQAWIENLDSIGMPAWLYLGSLSESIYPDQRFLELARALEGFHRYKYANLSETTEEHKNRLKSIIESCPKEYQKWLEGQLGNYSHEPKLPSRLKQLFKQQNEIVIWLAKSKPNMNRVKELIRIIRNHQAHCKSNDEQPVSIFLLIHINRYMQFVFAALLLQEIQFSDEQISNIIKSNWIGSQLPEQLSKALAKENELL